MNLFAAPQQEYGEEEGEEKEEEWEEEEREQEDIFIKYLIKIYILYI